MLEPTQAFEWLNSQPLYKAATQLVTAAAIIAAITPNQTDNQVLRWMRWIVDLVALNIGNAENKKK